MSSLSRRPSTAPRVICRPAGPGGDDVYATLHEAAAAARLAGPGCQILIDGDVTTVAVPHDLSGLDKIIGLGTITPTLTITDGTTFIDDFADFAFENVSITFGGATPVINVSLATITLERYATIAVTNTATAGFIEASGSIGVDMMYSNSITSVGGGAGHQVIKLGAGAAASIRVGNFGSFGANSITGGGDGAVEITDLSKAGGGAAASINQTQAGLTNPVYD